MYTTGIQDTVEMLTAINMDGTILWNTIYGKAWERAFPNARCTPTIEGDYAYVISGNGHLACINITNGKLQWSYDGYSKYEGSYSHYGVAESPLIVDNKMIYTPGGEKTTMVAVDKYTGETVWMSESIGDKSSYCSPVLAVRDQYKLIITVLADYVICINADNGEFVWKYDYKSIDKAFSRGDINPVTPLVIGNDIFVTSGYNFSGIMLHMTDDFRSVSVKWETQDLDVHHGGAVAYEGYIYGANYTKIYDGDWVCINWETGELQYEQEWYSKGSIIATNGFLICYDERKGNIALVEANPNEFKIKSTFQIKQGKGPHWSHPTIYDDKLFIRHGKSLMVFDIGVK